MVRFKPRPTQRAQALRNNATDAEKLLWRHISRRQLSGYKFSRQIPVGPFIREFICRETKLIIELDGGQYAPESRRGNARTEYMEVEGFRVLRFWNHEVMENLEGVLQAIVRVLETPLSPAPSASGRGDQ